MREHSSLVMSHPILQDFWAAPQGTRAADRMNVRLALAYEDFVTWARAKKVELASSTILSSCFFAHYTFHFV